MREDVFKDHVAEYFRTEHLGVPMERLVWRNKNGSSTYYANFLCFRGYLVVTGDLYEAIYAVYGPEADLAFFSRCDASYLAQKLRGLNGYSEDSQVWDAKKAEKFVKEHLESECDDVSELIKREFLDDAEVNYGSEEEWSRFLDKCDDTPTIFGDGWWEYCSIGKVRNPQIDLQLEALRAAMKWLKANDSRFPDVKK